MAVKAFVNHMPRFGKCETGMKIGSLDASCNKPIHLVFHKRNDGRDNNRKSVGDHCGHLERNGLATAGGQQP